MVAATQTPSITELDPALENLTITELDTALARYAQVFEPGAIPAADAVAVLDAAARIENRAATIKAMAAKRVAETELWRREGDPSAVHYLARRSGMGLGAAREALATAGRLAAQPDVDRAARAGRLSAAQAALVSDAAAADPAAEARLVRSATARRPLSDTRAECQRTKRAADPDPDATYARIHRERSLREFTDSEGAWNLHVRNTPEAGAAVHAALQPLIDQLFHHARQEDRREPHEAYAADALTALAQQSLTANTTGEEDGSKPAKPPKYLGLVRADLAALVRGRTEPGEIVEITGIGPVPATRARELLGDAVLHLVCTKGVDVANVTYLGRGPNAAQKLALLWAQPACTVDTCGRTRRLQHDHRIPYTQTRHTRLDETDPLCEHHHYLKTHHGWALVTGTGRRPIVPPDHPHHPNNNNNGTTSTGGGGPPPQPDPDQPQPPEHPDQPGLFSDPDP